MKILFNKTNNGAAELKLLTGSYYQNNSFDNIAMDVKLETEALIKLIGAAVYSLAEDYYYNASGSYASLVEHIQLVVAYKATYNFYQSNIVSHEDLGRKIKIDNANEKMAWEWMYDRDDHANLQKAYQVTDRLLAFLDKSDLAAWKNSELQKEARKLLVNNTEIFNSFYPIDNSGRFYYTIQPFISQVQQKVILPALGKTKFDALLATFKILPATTALTLEQQNAQDAYLQLLGLVQEAMVLLTMVKAVSRLSLKVLPDGVVQQFKSMIASRNASQPALDATLKIFLERLSREADIAINEVKKHIANPPPTVDDKIDLLPTNLLTTKIFRT